MTPKAPQSLPKRAQTKPKGTQCRPQGSPKMPKGHPKRSQKRAKSAPRSFPRAQVWPQAPPECQKGLPKPPLKGPKWTKTHVLKAHTLCFQHRPESALIFWFSSAFCSNHVYQICFVGKGPMFRHNLFFTLYQSIPFILSGICFFWRHNAHDVSRDHASVLFFPSHLFYALSNVM